MTGSLIAEQLVVTSGSWSGMLIENQATGLDPTLYWEFQVDFADLQIPGVGSVSPSLTVDCVPLAAQAWDQIAPATVICEEFGEPVESSLYYFEHCRYDAVHLELLSQSGSALTAHIDVQGDIDVLGIDRITVEAPMTFAGIYVVLDSTDSLAAATEALSRFTDLSRLTGKQDGTRCVFRPAGRRTGQPPADA